MTHWVFIPSLPIPSTSISQPSACKEDKHPGCANPSNLLSIKTGFRHSRQSLFILPKPIDLIVPITYWPIHPPAPTWHIQSLSFLMDFAQLWEIFKRNYIHVMRVECQECTTAITPLCSTYAHSYPATTHLQHQPFPFQTSQAVCVYGTIKLAVHCGMQRLWARDACPGNIDPVWHRKRDRWTEKNELLQF